MDSTNTDQASLHRFVNFVTYSIWNVLENWFLFIVFTLKHSEKGMIIIRCVIISIFLLLKEKKYKYTSVIFLIRVSVLLIHFSAVGPDDQMIQIWGLGKVFL